MRGGTFSPKHFRLQVCRPGVKVVKFVLSFVQIIIVGPPDMSGLVQWSSDHREAYGLKTFDKNP
jgi:hypothetical protein